MVNKVGSEKYYIIISLILGLIVLGLSLYFIFNEYFNENELDWQQCRQSIILRNLMPEKDLGATISSKGLLPLKCKTQVVSVDYKDLSRVENEIAETIGSCWYLSGEGEYKIFPGASFVFVKADTPCMMCARIHLEEDVKDYYVGEKQIDIQRALSEYSPEIGSSFWEYLNPSNGNKAFMYFKGWNIEGFMIDKISKFTMRGLPNDEQSFSFPKYFSSEKGDLFVIYAEPTTEASFSAERGAKPYMVLLQYSDFDKLDDVWVKYEVSLNSKVCSSIESIPA